MGIYLDRGSNVLYMDCSITYLFISAASPQFWFKSVGTTAIIHSEVILNLDLHVVHVNMMTLYVKFPEIICYKKMLSFIKKQYRLPKTTDTSNKCVSIVYR